MKKNLFYLLTVVALLATFFSSCEKLVDKKKPGGKPGSTTVAEDKANIQKSFTQLKNLAQNVRSGSLYSFLEKFIGIGEHDEQDIWYKYVGAGRGDYTWHDDYEFTPGTGCYELVNEGGYIWYMWVGAGNGDYTHVYGYKYTPGYGDYKKITETYTYFGLEIPEFTETLVKELSKILPFDQIIDEGRFKMPTFAGKYTWDKNKQKWIKTAANNTIQILFPENASSSNNCDLGVTNYVDKPCNIIDRTIYLPTKLNSYFTKNGEKLLGVDVTASYTNNGIPQNASIEVYAKPISISTTLKQESASRYSANLFISDETNNANSLSVKGEVTLSNSINSYSDFTDCEVNYVKFTITQHNLIIEGTIDLKTINGTYNPTVSDINKCINVSVLYATQKVGTLKVEELGQEKQKYVFIYYKDGTCDNTSIYYEDFVTEIIDLFVKK